MILKWEGIRVLYKENRNEHTQQYHEADFYRRPIGFGGFGRPFGFGFGRPFFGAPFLGGLLLGSVLGGAFGYGYPYYPYPPYPYPPYYPYYPYYPY